MSAAVRSATAMTTRDLRRFARRQQDLFQPLVFFVIVVTLLGLAIGPDSTIFAQIAPAGVWIAVLLATTINLDSMFLSDFEDGTIELLLLSAAPLPALVAAKILAHWLASACPQIVVSVFVAIILGFESRVIGALVLTLLLGSPILSLIGAVASALTVGLRGGAMLQALIILPLYMPTLIFATAAMHNAALDLPIDAELYFLAGLAILAATLAPFAAAAALRIRLS
ncbi:MAG: heme exporter protein B [Gammaproteobacteria bacterium]|jgi:heme exporter protein B